MEFIKTYKWEIILVVLAVLFLTTPIQSHLKRIVSLATEIKPDENKQMLSNESFNLAFSGYKTPDVVLSKYKGKVIFLHFWGTWCPDCRLEMPDLNSFYEKNKNKVAFLMVAIEKGNAEQRLEKYFGENPNFKFPVYTNLGTFTKQLEPSQYPTTFIIDKNGFIVAKKIGATDWNSKEIQKMIDNL